MIALLAAAAGSAAIAQPAPSDRCEEGRGLRDGARVCEVRELTLPATGSVVVDAGRNGGVSVTGWERDEVLVRAVVHAWADDEQEASEIAAGVRVRTDGVIRSEGPEQDRRASWGVSYEIFAPHSTDLRLETHNGGISIEGVSGSLDFEALNGGIRLRDVGGNARGSTTNGGVDVILTGNTWEGGGLEVETTNGGVTLGIPVEYSARLETGTVNGSMRIDFPITVQGRIGREISTVLEQGGPLVRLTTVNGAVRVGRIY